MLALDTMESKNLQFEVQIQGILPDQLKGYLRFEIDNVEYGFPAKITESGISIDLPPMMNVIKKRLKDGAVIEGRLEVIGNGFYTQAWEGDFKVRTPLQVEAKLMKGKMKVTEDEELPIVEEKPEPKESVTVTSVVSEKPKTPVVIDEQDEDEDEDLEDTIQEPNPYQSPVPEAKKVTREDKLAAISKKKALQKLKEMDGLVDKMLSRKKTPKAKPKVVKESVKPQPKPAAKPRPKRKTITDKTDVLQYMKSKGLRNERVQEHILERAATMAGDDKDYGGILEQVKLLLSNKKLV